MGEVEDAIVVAVEDTGVGFDITDVDVFSSCR